MKTFKRIQCLTIAGSFRAIVQLCKPNGSVIRSRGYDALGIHSRHRLMMLANKFSVYPYFYQDDIVVTIVGNIK